MQRYRSGLLALASMATLLLACEENVPVQPSTSEPEILAVTAGANPYSVLSTIVRFRASHVDSARVLYARPGEAEVATPFYAIRGDSQRIATLGLYPEARYTHRVEGKGPGGSVFSDPVEFTTGTLPDFLEQKLGFVTSGSPSPGFILTGMLLRTGPDEKFVVAYNDSGRICWYRQLDGLGAFVGQQPHGNFTAFIGSSTGYEPTFGYYVEFRPDGELVETHVAPAPLYTDNHELLLTPTTTGRTTHLLSYDIRRVDLSVFGGRPDARVAGHQILRFGPDGKLEFMWNAWDHLEIEDWIEEPASDRLRTEIDFDHPNSLFLDQDGNYIVSFRHLGEVTKLDSQNGEILWRFGGRNNQFQFLDDPWGKFSGQHFAHRLENGNLLLFDNGLRHDPPESRAVEYELDLDAMTARLVWEFRHDPPLYTPFTGSVQRLQNGNTLVAFALTGVVTEVTPTGDVVWEGALKIGALNAILYRILKIGSLYEYVRP